MDHKPIFREFIDFIRATSSYFLTRLTVAGLNFEKLKGTFVNVLLVRRGANISVFVHASILAIAVAVLVGGGVFTSGSVVSGSYPGIAANPLVAGASEDATGVGVISSSITPVTIISEKPRDKIVNYVVREGDTISSVAQQWGVSDNTIIWENDLSSTSKLKIGQNLRILPVSGVAHKVAGGDSIYSVAKKYQANAQAIIDFPFNDVGDDFQLSTGQVLIVPDGAPQAEPKQAPTQYLAPANIPVTDLGSSQFVWPAVGLLAQYFSWYHPAVDISNISGGPIHASDSGTVTISGWDGTGYGNTIVVNHGNGYTTRYAHMSALYASVGQKVNKGDVIGAMGSTGRSTGIHLHFEIRKDGIAQNPLSFLSK